MGTSKGVCRFCEVDSPTFKQCSHTFPEALGNKWVFSRDECDCCNALFSKYETALVDCLKPLLTMGGVKGKKRIPQSGRTLGSTYIKHSNSGEPRRQSWHCKGESLSDYGPRLDQKTGLMDMKLPIPEIPFVPRYAYKALAKMGYALLPDDELKNYAMLKDWLQNPKDQLNFPILDVQLSFASIGNAPSTVSGVLLRRTDSADEIPHILFIFSAGSICLQIDLMSDHLEDHISLMPAGFVKLRWTSVIEGDQEGKAIKLTYSEPVTLNWNSSDPSPQPIESMNLKFNPITRVASFHPNLRG
ncbi:hypothetical protein MLD52_09685 [Puniceicoccaceae bacterium K14]|nr:hypothetical protein [Puniceicoccaceae bacterium K14]